MPKHATLNEAGKVCDAEVNKECCFPVGIVIWTVADSNPASLMGFGTWAKVTLAPAFPVFAWKRTV